VVDVEFPLLGQTVAVDLVNTLWAQGGRVVDALDSVGGADRWLVAVAGNRLSDGTTLQEAAGAVAVRVRGEPFRAALAELRDQARDLLIAGANARHPTARSLDAVNRRAAAAPSRVQARVDAQGGWSLRRLRQPPLSIAVLAALAEDVLATAALGTGLIECTTPSCLGVFVQDDPRRYYCSPACANRARVARHYARTHGGPDSGS
jgi:predicted RNA-binding Zn ribbon-like protein